MTHEIKRGKLCKRSKNKSEQSFIDKAEAKGWKVIRKGWPDYLCFKLNDDGSLKELMAVEVKPDHKEGLKLHQKLACSILSDAGISCYYYGAIEQTLRKIDGKNKPL